MLTLIEALQNLIKSYTIAAYSANTTGSADKRKEAQNLLNKINDIRLQLAINAEMREIFYQQFDIAAGANATTQQNYTFSKNDLAFTYRRGVANLLAADVYIGLLNQATSAVEITRNLTNWQELFADIQRIGGSERGQQILFDFPETLIFNENASLNVSITGQTETGQLFLHGATLKDELTNSAINDLRREFLDDNGNTKYLPQTQIIPLRYQFLDADNGTLAKAANGASEILSDKNDKTVLLTEIGITNQNCRIDKLTDEGRNQTIAERIETCGVAAQFNNRYCVYYPLPEPHLLRRGDRLKVSLLQGSSISDSYVEPNTIQTLAFRGFTI